MPTEANLKKVHESLIPRMGRLSRAAMRSHMTIQEQFHHEVNSNFSCRILKAKGNELPEFTSQKDLAPCAQERVQIEPGEVYEISYELVAPYVELDEFNLNVPTDCSKGSKNPPKAVFQCLDR